MIIIIIIIFHYISHVAITITNPSSVTSASEMLHMSHISNSVLLIISKSSFKYRLAKMSFKDLCLDLEKAASGASGTCRHSVKNPAILRTFLVKNPKL